MDSDTILLDSLMELWSVRFSMNSSQAVGATYKDFKGNSYPSKKYPLPIVLPWGTFIDFIQINFMYNCIISVELALDKIPTSKDFD